MTTEFAGADIRVISARDTWPVRHAVLRPGQPLSSCDYEIDSMPGSFHLGSFVDGQLACIGSFYPDPHPELHGLRQFRLRGMATLHELQGRGLGRSLLQHAVTILQRQGSDMLWCNARVSAAGYYIKLGLQRTGEEFEIPNIGPHWLMYMELNGQQEIET